MYDSIKIYLWLTSTFAHFSSFLAFSIADLSIRSSVASKIFAASSIFLARNNELTTRKHPFHDFVCKFEVFNKCAALWYCLAFVKLSARRNTSSSCPWLKLEAWLHQYTAVSGNYFVNEEKKWLYFTLIKIWKIRLTDPLFRYFSAIDLTFARKRSVDPISANCSENVKCWIQKTKLLTLKIVTFFHGQFSAFFLFQVKSRLRL